MSLLPGPRGLEIPCRKGDYGRCITFPPACYINLASLSFYFRELCFAGSSSFTGAINCPQGLRPLVTPLSFLSSSQSYFLPVYVTPLSLRSFFLTARLYVPCFFLSLRSRLPTHPLLYYLLPLLFFFSVASIITDLFLI